jgi:hypothetical protein
LQAEQPQRQSKAAGSPLVLLPSALLPLRLSGRAKQQEGQQSRGRFFFFFAFMPILLCRFYFFALIRI